MKCPLLIFGLTLFICVQMYPDMSDEQRRLSTYTDWPPDLELSPQELAEAGLFYEGMVNVGEVLSTAL